MEGTAIINRRLFHFFHRQIDHSGRQDAASPKKANRFRMTLKRFVNYLVKI
jgi:hypothetical protein